MMKKKLLYLTLVLGISFVSCQDKIGGDDDGLVDVTLEPSAFNHMVIEDDDSNLKSKVSSGGFTSWADDDIVYVVDANGVPRPFNIIEKGTSNSKFSGKLLANHGTNRYYAYHAALKSPCELNGSDLTITREDLEYYLDDATKAFKKGEYCSMVAIPISFDAEKSTDSKDFNFYHANSLIEARVYPDDEGVLANMEFNKVVFSITAIEPREDDPEYEKYNNLTPFNSKIKLCMKTLSYDDETETVGGISYTSAGELVGTMTSTITYPEGTKFSERLTDDEYYDIPIYALPTKAYFACRLDVIFYNCGEEVCHLQILKKFRGLRLAGLNDPNFEFPMHSVVEP